MNDDLLRAFAEQPDIAGDDAFVARVTRRIAWRRRMIAAAPLGVAAMLLLAVWATWPAAYDFSVSALTGIRLLATSTDTFFTSDFGAVVAGILVLTGALWAWVDNRVRGRL